jgi:dienelactone hydrolase
MHKEVIRYKDGATECVGYLAHPDGKSKVPAVLIAHAWDGCDEFARSKARALAELGYAGVALDIYGAGKCGSGPQENAGLMQPFLDDRAMLRRRLGAGLSWAAANRLIDAKRIAAMGFCFGGLCVLDMARSGADLRGVISFHGLFTPAAGIPNARIKARVLALHGYDDPMVPPNAVLALAKELTESGADWQIHAYGNTLHAFTNPAARDRSFGAYYDANADRRSWETTINFLKECLA